MNLSFTVNGIPKNVQTDPWISARELLAGMGFFNVRNGCDGEGTCGMCTVLLNGKTVNSCLLSAVQLQGAEIRTVDGYNRNRVLSAVQEALIESGVVQCGYCTPAMVVAMESLLSRNPEPDEEAVRDAFSAIFCRCTGYRQIFDAVRLAREKLRGKGGVAPDSSCAPQPKTGENSVPRFREDLAIVGKGAAKIDGWKLARGERAFVEDAAGQDTCHLRMLRSPYAHAYITDIDTSKAENLPGVVAVLTYKNTPSVHYNQAGQGFPEPSPYDRRLFGRKLRHVGDRVAAVVARTPEIADEAVSLISVTYQPIEPVFSFEDALRPGAPLVHGGPFRIAGKPETQAGAAGCDSAGDISSGSANVTGAACNGQGHADPDSAGSAGSPEGEIIYQFPIGGDPSRNIAASVQGGIGDVDRGFAEADVVIMREYSASQVQCTPLEPHVVFTRMDGDRLVIHASTQVPWHVRRIVSYILGIGENRVRVIKERVGGGFGAKQDIVLEDVCAYATWITGLPVLFRFTREEEFIASRTRHPMDIGVELGAKRDGTITAIRMSVRANTGPYGSHCLTVPMNACSKSLPLFLCPNVSFRVTTCYSNIPPAGAYQGYGAPQGSFALQTAAAELAAELGMDQLELIEKNRVREGSVLEILKCLGEGRPGAAQTVSSCGLGPALRQGAELIGWGRREESGDPDVSIGKGFAIIQQGSGLPGLDASNTDIKMLWDGSFLVKNGGADLGTGLDTVVAKVAAESLKVPMTAVTILTGDTDTTPFDTGAYASSGTFFSGNATIRAAKKMETLIVETAAQMLGEPAALLSIAEPGKVRGGSREITYAEIAAFTQGGTGKGELSVSAGYTTEDAAIPYGAHFCQVAVNRRTGEIRVQKYYALQDCGTPINPELALGQIYGGVMKALGHTLWEEMRLDGNGRCLNPNFTDYKVPMIGDIPPDFKAILVPTDDPFGPFGGKSVSEISMNGTAPAVAVAIHDAVGVWIRDWPITPEKILRALGTIGQEGT